MSELIKASRYYRNRAQGWVLLRNGQPYHYTGRTAKRDALSALRSGLSVTGVLSPASPQSWTQRV